MVDNAAGERHLNWMRPLARLVARTAPLACLLAAAVRSLDAQLPPVRADAVGMSQERIARMRPAMQRFVDAGDVAGVVTLVARNGRLVAIDTVGWADAEARKPMRPTTIFRIASMSKAVTSVAVMMLVEEGKLRLSDPVGRYIPAFDSVRVAATPTSLAAPKRAITIRDLLTHRSGLAYGFIDTGLVGNAYRAANVNDGIAPAAGTLAENIDRLAHQPLSFEPGARWQYSLATDVLGRVVEVASGMPLDRFFRERIFVPLRMTDTDFWVPDEKLARLAVPYTFAADRLRPMEDPSRFFDGRLVMGGKGWRGSRSYFSGGAGLFSTAGDYARFLEMLLEGGELDHVRILSPKTIELMTSSATGDLGDAALGRGLGFGLGFQVVTDLGARGVPSSPGAYAWGGIYGSDYFVDPQERLVAVMMIQVFPGRAPVAETFETMVYQAITRSTAAPR